MAKRGPSIWNRRYGFKVMEWRSFKRGIKSFFCIALWLFFSIPMRYSGHRYKRGFLWHLSDLLSYIRRLFSGNRGRRTMNNPLSVIKSSRTKRGVASKKTSKKVKKKDSQSQRTSVRMGKGKYIPAQVKKSNLRVDRASVVGDLKTDKNSSSKKMKVEHSSIESKKIEISAAALGVVSKNKKPTDSFYKVYDGFYQSGEVQSSVIDQVVQLPTEQASTQYSDVGNPLTLEEMKVYKLSIVQEGEQDVKPITNGDKTFGTLWNENVDSFFSEYIAELQEGKRLVEAVKNLKITKGRITAEVKEEDKVAYKVIVTIESLTETERKNFYEGGENQKDLFPSKKDFWLFCNCDIEKKICPHMMATLYAVGALMDEDGAAICRLRGVKE